MAAVGLTVQAAGRHTGVEVGRAVGHRHQQMQQVQAHHPQRVRVVVERDVETLPQVRPLADVSGPQVAVAAELAEQALRGVAGFGDAVVTAGEDGGHLLHRHRLAGLDGDDIVVSGASRLVDEPAVGLQRRLPAPHGGAGRHRDRNPGLHGLAHQQRGIRRQFLVVVATRWSLDNAR